MMKATFDAKKLAGLIAPAVKKRAEQLKPILDTLPALPPATAPDPNSHEGLLIANVDVLKRMAAVAALSAQHGTGMCEMGGEECDVLWAAMLDRDPVFVHERIPHDFLK